MPWQGEKASTGNAWAHYLCFRYILYMKKKKAYIFISESLFPSFCLVLFIPEDICLFVCLWPYRLLVINSFMYLKIPIHFQFLKEIFYSSGLPMCFCFLFTTLKKCQAEEIMEYF